MSSTDSKPEQKVESEKKDLPEYAAFDGSPEQVRDLIAVRMAFEEVARILLLRCPATDDQESAIRALKEGMQQAIGCIVLHHTESKSQ